MTRQQFRRTYQTHEFTGMSPEQLVLALLEASLRFLDRAREAITEGDIGARGEAVSKVLDVVSELQTSLDLERGGEIAQNLFALYAFSQRELVSANLRGDATHLDNVERVLVELRDGWAEMLENRTQETPEEDPAPDSGGLAEYA